MSWCLCQICSGCVEGTTARTQSDQSHLSFCSPTAREKLGSARLLFNPVEITEMKSSPQTSTRSGTLEGVSQLAGGSQARPSHLFPCPRWNFRWPRFRHCGEKYLKN
ncbi:unnamed protein product [Gadus morhua 'NCC']